MNDKPTENSQSPHDELEALRARVAELEALMADKDKTKRSKTGTSGWATFFAVLIGILMYRLFRYLSG